MAVRNISLLKYPFKVKSVFCADQGVREFLCEMTQRAWMDVGEGNLVDLDSLAVLLYAFILGY